MTKTGITSIVVTALLAVWLITCLVAGEPTVHPGGDGPEKSAPPEAAVQPNAENATASTATDPATDKEMLAQWHKNLDTWKETDLPESADNSFCLVCHANYKEEKLVRVHETQGIGCETCHGMSDKHSEDEDSLIPPDILFAKPKVGLFCVQCHEKVDLLQSDEAHVKYYANEAESKKLCTNCHNMHHELKVRTRRWDKLTRKLDWYDGVRMMQRRDGQKQ